MGSSVSVGVMFRREQAPEHLVPYARRVEAAGFDELWVVEDCFFTGGVAQAATALTATERITVGLGIAPAVARNASFLAMEFATLARMHPGRFHGGIGHGVDVWMDQIGARPASWLAALEETTNAVRALLAGDVLNGSGRTVRLRDVRLEHVPEPPPPISLGVRGAKSLALSGRCADGTILAENSSPAYLAWARAKVEEGRHSTGHTRPHRLTVYANCAVSPIDPDGARALIRRATAESLGYGGATVVTAPLPFAAELESLIAQGGTDALLHQIPDAWLDDLAITGRPDEGAAAIERLRAAGADAVVLVPPVDMDPDAWLDSVGDTLLPLLHTPD
jgi:5,10-methylenetetrahydromethanopterin reductase